MERLNLLRGTILTGFPWNLIVYTFSENIKFIGIISLIGTYSLNLIVISLFITPAIFILRKSKVEVLLTIIMLILPCLFFTYSTFQKKEFLNKEFIENSYTVRIIASNIDLKRFYDDTSAEEVINELISISSPEKNRNIFLWPEGIIPYTYQDELELYNDLIKQHFDEHHLIVLGLPRERLKILNLIFYNSISVFDNNLN